MIALVLAVFVAVLIINLNGVMAMTKQQKAIYDLCAMQKISPADCCERFRSTIGTLTECRGVKPALAELTDVQFELWLGRDFFEKTFPEFPGSMTGSIKKQCEKDKPCPIEGNFDVVFTDLWIDGLSKRITRTLELPAVKNNPALASYFRDLQSSLNVKGPDGSLRKISPPALNSEIAIEEKTISSVINTLLTEINAINRWIKETGGKKCRAHMKIITASSQKTANTIECTPIDCGAFRIEGCSLTPPPGLVGAAISEGKIADVPPTSFLAPGLIAVGILLAALVMKGMSRGKSSKSAGMKHGFHRFHHFTKTSNYRICMEGTF